MASDLIERLWAATMGFDWSDLPDDACIPAVPLLREAATALAVERERAEKAEKEARTGYRPQVIDYDDSGVSELVLTDEPHVYAEAATVFVIRDMETRRISGFQWFTKDIPNPQIPTSPKGGPDHG